MRYQFQRFTDGYILRADDRIAALVAREVGGWHVTDANERTEQRYARETDALTDAIDIAHRAGTMAAQPVAA